MSSKLRFVLIAAVSATGGALLASARQQNDGEKLFKDVLSIVSQRYVDKIEGPKLLEKAAYGLIESLDDPYAQLYSPKEQDEFTAQHQGNYGGVGMTIEMRDGVPTVTRVFPNTPAERAGMEEGDELVIVDGQSVLNWAIEKVTGRIKGEPGSRVALEYRRGGSAPQKVELSRAIVTIPAVAYSMKVDEFGYVPLLQFSETSAAEVGKAVQKLRSEGAKGIVLDLRGNGGGLLDQAVEIADVFLPAGDTVVVQRERAGKQVWVADDAEEAGGLPLVILVDEGSASASEVLAGALQDHDRALVLGTPTYGKGVVQTAYRVGEGSILKLTTGEWLTPAGRSIHRRREQVNGRWTVITDSAAHKRFQSVSGRALYGGGGIEPDVTVRNDTLTLGEQTLLKALQPQSQEFYLAYTGFAADMKSKVQPGFKFLPAWHDELFKRIQARGVKVTREQYDGGKDYIAELVAFRIARSAFGDAEAKRMFANQDLPLHRAVELLRANHTQKELLVSAKRSGE